jgi:hypothetical protein
MKQNYTLRNSYSIGVALLLAFSLTQCGLLKKNCCGYKGPVVTKEAIALYTRDHFIPKATIEEWTARFAAYKKNLRNDSSKSLVEELGSSYSYNGYYVNLILCDKGSIGTRILLGLDELYKLHFILVGINPDYTTLYIRKPGSYLSLPKSKRAIWGINGVDDAVFEPNEIIYGGLQFSQRP